MCSRSLGAPGRECQGTCVLTGGTTRDFSTGPIVVDDVERRLILEALRIAEWNRARAAELLGLSDTT